MATVNGADREPLTPRWPEPVNAVFWGLNAKRNTRHIYAGIRPLRSLPPRQGLGGPVDTTALPRREEPDPFASGPLQDVVDRRRARNRVARKQRRINRIRGRR